jgi:hypothetical protein
MSAVVKRIRAVSRWPHSSLVLSHLQVEGDTADPKGLRITLLHGSCADESLSCGAFFLASFILHYTTKLLIDVEGALNFAIKPPIKNVLDAPVPSFEHIPAQLSGLHDYELRRISQLSHMLKTGLNCMTVYEYSNTK